MIEYFFDSLARQVASDDQIAIIFVDYFRDEPGRVDSVDYKFRKAFVDWSGATLKHVNCKPTVWQGAHQLPRDPWWAKSAYLNTAICLCESSFVSFVDDRSVLGHAWLDRVKAARDGNYAVAGYYEKHANLQVEDGVMIGGELLGKDTRTPGHYAFDTIYGGHCALPLEWCLKVGGYPEICDSLGLEDSLFGNTLYNAGYPIHYDSDMQIFEDRTPGQIDGALKRADKNPHLGQQAKSWALVRMLEGQKTTLNQFDIRNIRDRVLLDGESLDSIGPFGPTTDFYDGQPISEME